MILVRDLNSNVYTAYDYQRNLGGDTLDAFTLKAIFFNQGGSPTYGATLYESSDCTGQAYFHHPIYHQYTLTMYNVIIDSKLRISDQLSRLH